MVELIEKRALILSVTIQVDRKKKQMPDNNTNKRKLYNKTLNNSKNTISLLGKLEFFLVPITGRHINAETLHQVVDMWNQYCGGVFTFLNSNGPIWDPEWCDWFFGPQFFKFRLSKFVIWAKALVNKISGVGWKTHLTSSFPLIVSKHLFFWLILQWPF